MRIGDSIPSIFSPQARIDYIEKVNRQLLRKNILDMPSSKKTVKLCVLSGISKFFLKIVLLFHRNETVAQLLKVNSDAELLLKACSQCERKNLRRTVPEGFFLPTTLDGDVDYAAAKALMKSKKLDCLTAQFEDIASGKMEDMDLHLSRACVRFLKTVAEASHISLHGKLSLSYFRQLFNELKGLTNKEGKNVIEQIEEMLVEKKKLYQDLSVLYHAQTVKDSLTIPANEKAISDIFSRHSLDLFPKVDTALALAKAVHVLESKVEKMDAIFRLTAKEINDRLAIFETSTSRLASEFSPEILHKPISVTMVGVEYAGLIKEGGLAEAVEGLSVAMKKQHPENHVRLIFPKFSTIPSKVREKLDGSIPREYQTSTGEKFQVFTTEIDGVECFFVDDPSFALAKEKPSIYGPNDIEVKTRFARFAQLAADLIPQLGKTDFIHLHDWHVAGVALKYKADHLKEWEEGKTPPIVFTFHNNGRPAQGRFFIENYNYENILQGLIKAGIATENTNFFVNVLQVADSATTVSPTFAIESQNVDTGEGVSFAAREAAEQGKFFGVINGSNPTRWDPSKDEQLKTWRDPETKDPVNLTFDSDPAILLEKKQLCKNQLAKWVKAQFPDVTFDPKKPIVTFIGRFDSFQKGLDKLDEAIESTLANGGQFICMGSLEDPEATKLLDTLQKKYAGKAVLFIRDYKDPNGRFHYQQGGASVAGIGSVVRASSDFLFIPSKFEPCGLVQFEGWLFGSLAIGSRVGGLADTIKSLSEQPERGNGFLFERGAKGELSAASVIKTALLQFSKEDPVRKSATLSRVMQEGKKYSWTEAPFGYSPVEQYRFVYENAKKITGMRAAATDGRKVDLLSLFRRVSSQTPTVTSNITEERYFRLHAKPHVALDKLERAYFSMHESLRRQAPDPYSKGVSFKEYERFGAHYGQDHTHFEVFAPEASSVSVKIFGTDQPHPMVRKKDGSWSIDLNAIKVGTKYQYVVNGQTKIDPYGRQTVPADRIGQPPFSVVQDMTTHTWDDGAWMDQRVQEAGRSKPMSTYEVYPTAWRKKDGRFLTYRELAPQLVEHCQRVGYTHVELMGLLEHPSEASWGYQVSGFFSPNSRMGSPDDLKYLIDYLHQNKIAVIMDFVPGHFAIDDYALNKFDGSDLFQPSKTSLLFSVRNFFFNWGAKFFNYEKTHVRNFLISSAAYWIQEMHVDALRVDAVHPILLSENSRFARLFLKQLNAVIHRNFPGVQTIAEDYSGQAATTQPFSRNGLGFDMKWNIGWMKHALDFFGVSVNQREARYKRIIEAVENDASHRMVMAISHDELKTGHLPLLKMTKGLSPEQGFSNLRAFFGFMYALPGKKLLFMGADTGLEDNWETLIGRETGVDDRALTESKKKLSTMLFDLNETYKKNRAFFEKDANGRDLTWIEKKDPNGQIVAYRRTSTDEKQSFACVHNFTTTGVKAFTIPLSKPIPAGQPVPPVTEIFNSEDVKYNGSGNVNSKIEVLKNSSGAVYAYTIQVPPLTTLIVRETV